MRSLLAILTFLCLLSLQGVQACCEHHNEDEIEVTASCEHESTQPTLTDAEHHHQHGPCHCFCHKKQAPQEAPLANDRLELKPISSTSAVVEIQPALRHAMSSVSALPFALPPPTAPELCSLHCRFLL